MFTDLINTFGEEYISRHLTLIRQAINEIEEASKQSTLIVNSQGGTHSI